MYYVSCEPRDHFVRSDLHHPHRVSTDTLIYLQPGERRHEAAGAGSPAVGAGRTQRGRDGSHTHPVTLVWDKSLPPTQCLQHTHTNTLHTHMHIHAQLMGAVTISHKSMPYPHTYVQTYTYTTFYWKTGLYTPVAEHKTYSLLCVTLQLNTKLMFKAEVFPVPLSVIPWQSLIHSLLMSGFSRAARPWSVT